MDFGKSLCVLCREPLAEASLVASPSDCPTHYFHFECLARHARQERRCPIDRVPFDNITCEDARGAAAPEEEEEKIQEDNKEGEKEEKKEEEDNVPEEDARERQENVNDLPPLATMKISCEDDDNASAKKESRQSTGQRILISNEPLGGGGGGGGEGMNALADNFGPFECGVCHRGTPGERASPDSCEHWFHKNCLAYYLKLNSVCPVRGCHREITTYMCSSGESRRIEMTVECEYRNMASAPDNFVCDICHEAEIGRHRAEAKPCGHMFHRLCLTEYVRNNKKCPTCQLPTTLITGCTAGDLKEMRFD